MRIRYGKSAGLLKHMYAVPSPLDPGKYMLYAKVTPEGMRLLSNGFRTMVSAERIDEVKEHASMVRFRPSQGHHAELLVPAPVSKGQLPPGLTVETAWTRKGWETLLDRLRTGDAVGAGPSNYPHCVPDLLLALEHATASTSPPGSLRAAVFSAISPWAEAALRHFGLPDVTSVDYNPASTVNMPPEARVRTLAHPDLIRNPVRFDLIVSFSGTEHDGLTRYGDPFHPDGDLFAVEEMALLLRPGGLLLLGVPAATPDEVCGAYHRIYGPARLPRLLSAGGLRCVGVASHGVWIGRPAGAEEWDCADPQWMTSEMRTAVYGASRRSSRTSCSKWKHQPIFVLQHARPAGQ